jgi:hypothetical protein
MQYFNARWKKFWRALLLLRALMAQRAKNAQITQSEFLESH